MVIQPMVIVASQGTCTQGQCCEATLVCHACKCCEVKTDGELCGCCIRSEVDADNCCSKKAAKPKHDNLLREISDVVPEPPESDDEELAQGRSRCRRARAAFDPSRLHRHLTAFLCRRLVT